MYQFKPSTVLEAVGGFLFKTPLSGWNNPSEGSEPSEECAQITRN